MNEKKNIVEVVAWGGKFLNKPDEYLVSLDSKEVDLDALAAKSGTNAELRLYYDESDIRWLLDALRIVCGKFHRVTVMHFDFDEKVYHPQVFQG